ncbi:nitrilase [Rhodovulum iodosum]|uniref:Nitrilase n=1 Tax=Rhodovulum iodosum TaxID=68291 RepID=A0ABV3XN36_9RHOB|nr:carbon-nitrogen hydrolase family protein [Rhodovulum robiginosum]RSK35859.1 carbon-nitrogen hydrolase family protein [Rhodovulum robiginosum]
MVRTAIVQQPPVYLDLEASLARAVALVEEAAEGGAGLVVFPEAWFPGYPTFVWRLTPGADMGKTDALFARLLANSVDLSRDGLAPLREVARERGVVVVAGVQECDAALSGSTIFNSAVVIDADGTIANVHRKLMPTNPERMVWGFGDGRGLRVVDTAAGRIGVLLCWENYMPLARYALYGQQLEILVSPTWDAGEGWLATMRHIAREGGCWVIGCSTPLEASDIPEDTLYRAVLFPDPEEWINDGDAVVMKPFGGPVAGPMHREKGLLWAEIDPAAAAAARRKFDVTGHYARPDIFHLSVNRSPQRPVTLDESD